MIDEPLYPQHTYEQPPEQYSPQKVGYLVYTVVLIVLAVNVLVGRYVAVRPVIQSDVEALVKWDLLAGLNEPVDWLFLGDSTGARAIAPEIVMQETGDTALNLAVNRDWSKPLDLIMLETHIRQVGPPEQVVLVYSYEEHLPHFSFDYRILSQLPNPYARRQAASYEREALTFVERAHIWLRWAVPLYYRSGSIQERVRWGLEDPQSLFLVIHHGEFGAYGAQRYHEPMPELVPELSEEYAETLGVGGVALNERDRHALERIMALAETHGFHVTVVNGPIYEGIADHPDLLTFREQQGAYFDAWAAQSEHVTYIHNLSPVPAHLLQDHHHVIVGGAEIYTRDIIQHIIKEGNP